MTKKTLIQTLSFSLLLSGCIIFCYEPGPPVHYEYSFEVVNDLDYEVLLQTNISYNWEQDERTIRIKPSDTVTFSEFSLKYKILNKYDIASREWDFRSNYCFTDDMYIKIYNQDTLLHEDTYTAKEEKTGPVFFNIDIWKIHLAGLQIRTVTIYLSSII